MTMYRISEHPEIGAFRSGCDAQMSLIGRSVKRLEDYLAAEGLPLEAPGIRGFLAAERDRTSPASAAKHYRNLLSLDFDQLSLWPGAAVMEADDPLFTEREIERILKAAGDNRCGFLLCPRRHNHHRRHDRIGDCLDRYCAGHQHSGSLQSEHLKFPKS